MDELELIRQSIAEINNHIAILNDEGGQIVERLIVIEKDMEWLLKFFWLIMAGVLGNMIAHYFNWKSLRNNNKK